MFVSLYAPFQPPPGTSHPHDGEQTAMRALARWCMGHQRRVVLGWLAIALLASVLSHSAGPSYMSTSGTPGSESLHARELLKREFPAQSGDIDTIVFHVAHGTVDSRLVRSAVLTLLRRVEGLPHVAGIVSPYSTAGAAQVSADRTTAFATVDYDKQANLLPSDTGKPLLLDVKATQVKGLEIAAGGKVVEQAEGFSTGPATAVGVVAALLILLLTFGSLTAAGLPLITAGLGLVTGVALIGIATHLTSMSSIAPDLALMIGLGVGIDYALFIVTRFRESYAALGDVELAVLEAMDTSGRAILLAGTTVTIALLGMFATGVAFMYGLAIAAVIAVLLTLLASLTLLPALLARFGPRLVRVGASRPDPVAGPLAHPAWRRWSATLQRHPWPLSLAALALIAALLTPLFALRLDESDAGNDAPALSSRHAFDLLARGFGQGFNGPLLLVAELSGQDGAAALPGIRASVRETPGIVAVSRPRLSPSGTVAVMQAYPSSAPQALATSELIDHLRRAILPSAERGTGVHVLLGGFTATSIDFSDYLTSRLPLFFGLVVALSMVLLLLVFRSIVIPLQAAVLNLLTVGASLGATVAVFQWGWLGGLLDVQKGPIEAWVPVIMFAVVFGLSMDYEVFLVSRIRERWLLRRDSSSAVAEGLSLTGRVITAAAAIMFCVFLSFVLGDARTLKEFGFALAVAVLVDALIVRCVLLPASLELLGPITWSLPGWLDSRLPRIDIEGSTSESEQPIEEPDSDSALILSASSP